jgi:transcriptional regulator
MYIPKSFSVSNAQTLYQFMRANNFATLVTQHQGQMTATSIPFMIDSERGVLKAHLARANDQWKQFGESEALVIFQGPHAYISPSWYETHPSVPTWNYTAVHVYGVPAVCDDPETVREMLHELVENHEHGRIPEWQMELPENYLHTMMQSIVAFELKMERIEGKFKLSQNRSAVDQENVISQLKESAYPLDREVAQLMTDQRSAKS